MDCRSAAEDPLSCFSTRLSGWSLALTTAMTAAIVVAASIVVERSGPFIGAMIAALPTAAGARL